MEFIVHGRMPGLNEYTRACRSHWAVGAAMKREAQDTIAATLAEQLPRHANRIEGPVELAFAFYEPNKKRDRDNIAGFAHKVVLDALVENGLIQADGWGTVIGWTDSFAVDKSFPRIEVTVRAAS